MSKTNGVYVLPYGERNIHSCRYFWSAIRRFFGWLGHDRLPEFIKVAVSVAEPAGHISLRSEPLNASTKVCEQFTVISANLWHDWPRFRDQETRLDAFAQLVESENADLVLLQEVSRSRALKADDWLAQRLQMAYVYSRANGSEKLGFEEGLGVFSRFPLKRLPHVVHMGHTCNPFVRRLALGVDVDTPCGEILAFSVHLGLMHKQNSVQLRELHHWVSQISAGRATIIGGDFNATEDTHQIQNIRSYWQDTFREIHEHGRAVTHEIRWPWGGAILSHRLDYIFLQPGQPEWQVAEVRHLDGPGGPHSDHRAVLARLTPLHSPA